MNQLLAQKHFILETEQVIKSLSNGKAIPDKIYKADGKYLVPCLIELYPKVWGRGRDTLSLQKERASTIVIGDIVSA